MHMKRLALLIRCLLLAALWAAPIAAQASGPHRAEYPADLPVELAIPFVPGELLVRLEPGASLAAVARSIGASLVASFGGDSIHILRLQQGSVGLAVHTLRGNAGVTFAEPNWVRQLYDAPDDPGYPLKWDLHNDGSLCQGDDCASADADVDWQEAYTHLGSDFQGAAVVAVVDTGIDADHPDLKDKIVPGYDFLGGDADPLDTYGHGTHVAGIALAATNNGLGTAGVGFSAGIQVMPLRVCDQSGCPSSAVAQAIYYAADHDADVVNLSLGGRIASAAEEQAIAYAWSKGVVVVASSGNDGSGKVAYPAAFAHCIAVGSTNWRDERASYSNQGNDLDVVAPGGEMSFYGHRGGIYSTMPTYDVYLTTVYGYSRDYDYLQGTSMAAPQVSGLAALLVAMGVGDSDGDGKANDEVRDLIETTTDDLGKSGWDRTFGWGRINVHGAVLAAVGSGDTLPSVAITHPAAGATVSGSVNITAVASDDGAVLQVAFFADGQPIGLDSDSVDGWWIDWDTAEWANGEHELKATATDSAGQTGSHTISVVVGNAPSAEVVVTAATPSSVPAGATVELWITGRGFAPGAGVSFENGQGPAPAASRILVDSAEQIRCLVTAKSGGPPSSRLWDVQVTNPDGARGVLIGGLLVVP
jgi:thermitase